MTSGSVAGWSSDATIAAAIWTAGEAELRDALERQRTQVRAGVVALVRTGRMTLWPDTNGYIRDEAPTLSRRSRSTAVRGALH